MQTGTMYHAELENWSKHAPPPHTPSVRAALEYLPEPHKDLLVEHRIDLPTYDGGPSWLGFIDLADLRDPLVPVVYDHKTAGDMRYAKRPSELAHTVQMNSYARWAGSFSNGKHGKPPQHVRLQHTYMLTKGVGATPVNAIATRESVTKNWDRDLALVRKMTQISLGAKTPDDVTPNPATCGAFGGCPYRDRCGLPQERLFSMSTATPKQNGKNGSSMSLAAQLAAHEAAPAAAAAQAAKKT